MSGHNHSLDKEVNSSKFPYSYTAVTTSSPDFEDGGVPVWVSSVAVAGGVVIAAIVVVTTILCVCAMTKKRQRWVTCIIVQPSRIQQPVNSLQDISVTGVLLYTGMGKLLLVWRL